MRVRTSRDIGSIIHTARKDAGLSQTELAQLSGCSQRFVSQLERGKRTAELGKVLDVIGALGLSMNLAPKGRLDGRALVSHTMEETTRRLEMHSNGITTRHLADYLSGADAHESY